MVATSTLFVLIPKPWENGLYVKTTWKCLDHSWGAIDKLGHSRNKVGEYNLVGGTITWDLGYYSEFALHSTIQCIFSTLDFYLRCKGTSYIHFVSLRNRGSSTASPYGMDDVVDLITTFNCARSFDPHCKFLLVSFMHAWLYLIRHLTRHNRKAPLHNKHACQYKIPTMMSCLMCIHRAVVH